MAKTITLRVGEGEYRLLSRQARAERRSLANFIEVAALDHVMQSAFIEDEEMREILANPRLVRRLQEGSRNARARRGRFVG